MTAGWSAGMTGETERDQMVNMEESPSIRDLCDLVRTLQTVLIEIGKVRYRMKSEELYDVVGDHLCM